MLVYKSQGQEIEDGDVVCINMKDFYIVAYDMRMCAFILYPLGGHSLKRQHVAILDESCDWEYLGHISDEGCYTQLNLSGGVGTYIAHMQSLLSYYP